MVRVIRSLFASVFSILIAVSPMMAQQAQTPDPAAASTPQKLTKEQKKKMGRALKELDAQYKQWAQRRCHLHHFARRTHGILAIEHQRRTRAIH